MRSRTFKVIACIAMLAVFSATAQIAADNSQWTYDATSTALAMIAQNQIVGAHAQNERLIAAIAAFPVLKWLAVAFAGGFFTRLGIHAADYAINADGSTATGDPVLADLDESVFDF